MAVSSKNEVYHISGVPVRFPCKPYPTQLQMMSKIIQALNKGDNALLESPTGSGKSLALLCSALAWQKHDFETRQSLPSNEPTNPTTTNNTAPTTTNSTAASSTTSSTVSLEATERAGVVNRCHCVCHNVKTEDQTRHSTCQPMNKTINIPTVNTCTPNIGITNAPAGITDNPSASNIGVANTPAGIINTHTSAPNIGITNTDTSAAVTNTTNTDAESHDVTVTNNGGDITVVSVEDDGDDFKPTKKRFRTPVTNKRTKSKRFKGVARGVVYDELDESSCDSQLVPNEHGHPTWKMLPVKEEEEMVKPDVTMPDVKPIPPLHPLPPLPPLSCQSCGCVPNMETGPLPSSTSEGTSQQQPLRYRPMRIFYGTRTHRQISQITHELAKTAYSKTPMDILASRDHTCIHPEVSRSRNKKEECKILTDYKRGISCPFYHKVQQKLGHQSKLIEQGITSSWDIEDLVKLGRKIKACPYYASRALLEGADIIFCPYNYLIDPLIREQMLIKLEDCILIFDEAHNMEDAAREASSLTVNNNQLKEVEEEMDKILAFDGLEYGESYRIINVYIHNIAQWMETQSQNLLVKKFEESCTVWNGNDFLPFLKQMGISIETYSLIMNHVRIIINDTFEQQPDKKEELVRTPSPKLPVGSVHIIDSLFIIMGYLFTQSHKYLEDYRVALRKTVTHQPQKKLGGWRGRRSHASEKVWVITLNFWCLNPAVAFSELQVAHSIILTSGTLSPMSSFSSELGVVFPIQLEANHVVAQSQTWVSTLSHGPNSHPLNATYQFADTFQFQDEVGAVILEVCKVVPFGVLCFVSSYKLLEKLTSRWQDTGVWYQILKKKHIVCEPRASDKADFEIVMSQFYTHVQSAAERAKSEVDDDSEFIQDGAVFFAVCRGKVSEGLDFADNNARAVITVGIPFPNIKDEQVGLKREYNNSLSYQRGLLSGSEWYEIQAYRALNQALGRCIRHKKDWGALILIDERFGKGKRYVKGLSKWVRQRVSHHSLFSDAMSSLHEFVSMHIQRSKEEEEALSQENFKKQDSSTLHNDTTLPFNASMLSNSTTPSKNHLLSPTSPSLPQLSSPSLPVLSSSPSVLSNPSHSSSPAQPLHSRTKLFSPSSDTSTHLKSPVIQPSPAPSSSLPNLPSSVNPQLPLTANPVILPVPSVLTTFTAPQPKFVNPLSVALNLQALSPQLVNVISQLGPRFAHIAPHIQSIISPQLLALQSQPPPQLSTANTIQSLSLNNTGTTAMIASAPTVVSANQITSFSVSSIPNPITTLSSNDNKNDVTNPASSVSHHSVNTRNTSPILFDHDYCAGVVVADGLQSGPVDATPSCTTTDVIVINDSLDEMDEQQLLDTLIEEENKLIKNADNAAVEPPVTADVQARRMPPAKKMKSLKCQCGLDLVSVEGSIAPASKTLQGLLSISESMYKTTSLSSLFLPNDPVFLLPADKLASTTEIYSSSPLNAVWEIGMCYSILQCTCGQIVGIQINACDEENLIAQAVLNSQIVSVVAPGP